MSGDPWHSCVNWGTRNVDRSPIIAGRCSGKFVLIRINRLWQTRKTDFTDYLSLSQIWYRVFSLRLIASCLMEVFNPMGYIAAIRMKRVMFRVIYHKSKEVRYITWSGYTELGTRPSPCWVALNRWAIDNRIVNVVGHSMWLLSKQHYFWSLSNQNHKRRPLTLSA